MAKSKTTKDIELYSKFQASPIFFIEKMWGLAPQPVRKEFETTVKAFIDSGSFQEIKKEWFEPFEKGKHITWQQWMILLCVEKALRGEDKKRISIVSGHGTGKSCTLAWLIIWYLFCFKDAQIPCTAPSAEQMHDILWKELSIWLDKLPEQVAAKYDYVGGYLRIKERPRSWFARAKTARKENPEALAGVHSNYVLTIVDEGSGVPEEIFNTAEGALTGENVMVIMISNGTRNEGYFYDSHHSDAVAWQQLSLNSEDSPIVESGYIERIATKHGKDSDEYKIRVLGQFPEVGVMDSRGYVPLINENQIIKSPNIPFTGRVKMGIDPAGEGDDQTVWCGRDVFIAKVLAIEQTSSPKSIALKTATLVEFIKEKAKIDEEDIIIDDFGVGSKVSTQLAILKDRILAETTNWAEKADDEEVYANKRAECYFRARQWLIEGGMIADDNLIKELTKIKYRRTIAGKKIIMEKKELKKEMKRSPDNADAFALTFFTPDDDNLEAKTVVPGRTSNNLSSAI